MYSMFVLCNCNKVKPAVGAHFDCECTELKAIPVKAISRFPRCLDEIFARLQNRQKAAHEYGP